jgi:hypothetical protein
MGDSSREQSPAATAAASGKDMAMSTIIEQSGGAVGAPSKRLLLTLSIGALVLAVTVSVGAWRALDRSEPDAASVATVTIGATARNAAPLHATAADGGRLTVYLVGSSTEAGAAYQRIAADQELRAQNWAPPLNASVFVAGSPDQDRQAGDWVTAVREGLGVPVDVLDLRPARSSGASDCEAAPRLVITVC